VSPPDRWTGGADYELFIGRWSRLVAARFVEGLAISPGGRWVDVGAGTGALSATILQQADPASVVGVEPSPEFVGHAQQAVTDARVRFVVGSAGSLPLEPSSADVVVFGLVLNFVPDVSAALQEARRACVAGGTVAAYVWDYAGRMELLRRFWDAAVDLDPGAAPLDEGRRFPICAPEPLAAAFDAADLADVTVESIEVPTLFRDFNDYWAPFLTGVGPAPGYVASLADDRRSALRERLRSTLPSAPDGSIPLVARAWAVRGRSPGPAAGTNSRTIRPS
jgi:SAM-dependent methyltransferase